MATISSQSRDEMPQCSLISTVTVHIFHFDHGEQRTLLLLILIVTHFEVKPACATNAIESKSFEFRQTIFRKIQPSYKIS